MNKSFKKYDEIEECLIQPIIDTNTSIELFIQNNALRNLGFIYTYFRDRDKKIKIGYSSNPNIINYMLGDYKLIEKRHGSEREFKLLSITLKELGHTLNRNQFNYNFSSTLIKHLRLLGWPVGSLGRLYKKTY